MKLVLCICSMMVILMIGAQAMAYSIVLNPASQKITQSDTAVVNIDLLQSGNEKLYGFNLALSFDPAILGFNGISTNLMNFADPMDPLYDYVGLFMENPGNVALIGQNIINPLTGNVTLASITFTGIKVGSSLLGLTGDLDLGNIDSFGNNILDGAAAFGSVNVVPEPATVLLLGLGMAGLLGFRKRFQKM